MGLSLVVGILPEMGHRDAGMHEYYQDQFKRLNQALRHAHIGEHHEPEQAAGVPWSCDMAGFKTLHYLRRLAAYICLREDLPSPGDDDCITDPIIEQWCLWATGHQPKKLMEQLLGDRVEEPIAYEHLMVHSDANGYYLPRQFNRVVIAPEHFGVLGDGLIGSAHAVRDDCDNIADKLGLPLDLDPNSDIVLEAAEKQGRIDGSWQPYGRESYACLQLYRAATKSIESGCAIVFT